MDAPALTVIGKPSASLADKIKQDAKTLIENNKKHYGPEGLAKLQKEIEEAQAKNDVPVPNEIIRKFPVPDVDGIQWIKVETARANGVAHDDTIQNRVQTHVDADKAEPPIFVQYDRESGFRVSDEFSCSGRPTHSAGETDINSAFIQISLVLFPESIEGYDDAELRALLPVYLDSFFTLPVSRVDGRELTYEEVVKELDAETLSYSINLNAPLQEGVTVKIKVAKDKYEIAIGWLHSLLYHSRFSPDRLRIAATKALQGLPSEKRDGSEVSYNAYRKMISEESR